MLYAGTESFVREYEKDSFNIRVVFPYKQVFFFCSHQFFTNYYNLRESYSICVAKCPDRTLRSLQDIQNYYNESELCDYSVKREEVTQQNNCKLSPFDCFGPCPALEVPEE